MKIILVLIIVLLPLTTADAHRSGCHRWHSCPSDRGTYVCGDTGHCNYCPDNKYCKDQKPRISSSESLEKEKNKPSGKNPDYKLKENN